MRRIANMLGKWQLLFMIVFTISAGAAKGFPSQEGELSAGAKRIDLQALNAKYCNAVVRIESTPVVNMEETKLNPRKSESYTGGDDVGAHGSGFFLNDSEIVTNAHVVEDARKGSIRIKTPASGNVTFTVDVMGVGGSGSVDLAVLKLPQDERMRYHKHTGFAAVPYLTFGDSDSLKQTDQLAIFGYPTVSDELKVIQAEVTGRQYQHEGLQDFYSNHQYIEVGPGGVVQPGNSGGPALDATGKVVGIPALGDWQGNQGWLIPIAIVREFIGRIRNNQAGSVGLHIPMLGVVLSKNSTGTLVLAGAPEEVVLFELGVIVREVFPKSMAEAWGLKAGDIIVGFANKQRKICCALDFEGYRVSTGKMSRWPQSKDGVSNSNLAKIHLMEMIFTSSIGDEITLWYVRPCSGVPTGDSLRTMTNRVMQDMISSLPNMGLYEKPEYEYWGDFVTQNFNEFNVRMFNVPVPEIVAGGVLVTYVEPNSLASHAGLEMSKRFGYGMFGYHRYHGGMRGAERWYIVEKVDGKPVADLKGFSATLREAEKGFVARQGAPGYRPERKLLYRERYVQLGVRTNTDEGRILHFDATFPIDEAMEYSGAGK
ncbi:MAG TPA: serine protease [Chitinivibrionales bacterium]|nr:serine protease [Chitinivibrionales bacterium]